MEVANAESNKLGVSLKPYGSGRCHVIITYFVPQGGTPFLVKSNAPVKQRRSQGFKLGDWLGSSIISSVRVRA